MTDQIDDLKFNMESEIPELDSQSLNQNDNIDLQSPVKNGGDSPLPVKGKNIQNDTYINGNNFKNKITPLGLQDEEPISTMKQNDPPSYKPKSQTQLLIEKQDKGAKDSQRSLAAKEDFPGSQRLIYCQ